MNFLLVMAGGAIGSVGRYGVGMLTLRALGPHYPWGTLAVNLIGGFLMGALAGLLARTGGSEHTRLLIGVGVLGGFTTFSAFSLDTVTMIERGQWGVAVGYALISVIASVIALFGGLWLVRALACARSAPFRSRPTTMASGSTAGSSGICPTPASPPAPNGRAPGSSASTAHARRQAIESPQGRRCACRPPNRYQSRASPGANARRSATTKSRSRATW